MNAHDLRSCHAFQLRSTAPLAPRLLLARETESAWAARAFLEEVPPASLGDARARRDELRTLLSRERAAAADFLLALADFDRRRGWERLGHASLFSFLTRELGLSAGAAQLRLSAARLLPRHPAVEAALRGGRLCLSSTGQLARVLTAENEAEVLPRFFGCSSREAQEVAAAILPAPVPARRELLTGMGAARKPGGAPEAPALFHAFGPAREPAGSPGPARQEASCEAPTPAPTDQPLQTVSPEIRSPFAPGSAPSLHAHEVDARTCAPRTTPQVVPLTADLRRLHLTVTAGFLERVAKARTGLSHALPGATTEQVLEAALAALLEKQARRKGLGKRAVRAASPAPPPASIASLPAPSVPLAASPPRSTATPPSTPALDATPTTDRPHIPAPLERAVRLRDGNRCQYPLDSGGVCGSTWQVELDHVVPVVLDGETSLSNLRCLCRPHNQAAAREALGRAADQRRPPARSRKGVPPPPGAAMSGSLRASP